MAIYVFQGAHKNKTEELLRKAICIYAKESCEESLDFESLTFADLKRTKNGKPFFEGNPIYFSISHTGEVWSCLISPENVGFDIQKIRKLDFNKLANRFFLDEEIKFVRDYGSDGFFDIWVRKEACIKYFGTGIRDIKSFVVVADGKLAEEIRFQDNMCFVNSFELAPDIKGAYCYSMKGVDVWIKELS